MKLHPPRAHLSLHTLLVVGFACLAGAAAAQGSDAQEQRILRGYAPYAQGKLPQAASLFRADAKRGVRAAQYNLAVMIMRGEINATPSPAELAEAVAWMRKAANAKFPDAEFALGKLYENGELIGRDLSAALSWFRRAAEQNHLDAQLELAASYMLGRGTAKDLAQAAQWAEKAAAQGDAGAQYLLASFYEAGDGVTRDLQKAFDWYAQAARNGDPSANFKAKEIAARMRESS
jgi:uncharacterized protein